MTTPIRQSLGKRLLIVGALVAALGGGLALRHTQTSAQAQGAQEQGSAEAGRSGVKQDARHNEAHHYARELSLAFRQAAQAAIPTVVTVTSQSKPHAVTGNAPENSGRGENPFKGTPFENFFKDLPGEGGSFGRSIPRHAGMGSGVIIDKSGVILTNNHVVDGADEVNVRLSDGREFKAKDIKTDKQTDLAIIRIEGAGKLPAAPLGNSDNLEVGDWVIAVGNPFNQESTVSAGIISGKGRPLGGEDHRTDYLQTDAAINPGNSGGPLVNLDGEVVGINTAIASSSGGFQGVGFAIPVNLAKWVANQLVTTGSVQRAYLGVEIREVSGDLAQQFGVHRFDGLLVGQVMPGSPAADAGFQEGDLVTDYAGQRVRRPRDLQSIVERTAPGTKQEVKIVRAGKPMTLSVAVKPLPENVAALQANKAENDKGTTSGASYSNKDFGLEVAEMSPAAAEQFGFTGHKGVLISAVQPNGIAAERGLAEGMLILKVKVGDVLQGVASVSDFEKAMVGSSPEKGVVLLVRASSGRNAYVVLKK